MSIYLKASAICLVIAGLFAWGFYTWREQSFTAGPVSSLSFIEKLEQEGFPPFRLMTIDGKKFDSAEHEGKAILVNFWASWCAPCLEEFPSMIKLVKETKGKLVLLAISQDSHEAEIQAFLKAFPEAKEAGIYVVWDQNKAISRQFRVTRLPESFLSNGQHKLAKKIIGSIQWFTPESVQYIESLVSPK